MSAWRRWARALKVETYALYFVYRDPRVPLHARIFIACVVGYALSPIDLIPDPIPVLGYLDDLILVPLGIWLAIRMVPPQVLADARDKAAAAVSQGKPINRLAGAIIVAIWGLCLAFAAIWIVRLVR